MSSKKFKVVVDCGHGINTSGKRSPAGEREWSFNSTVGESLIAFLKDSDIDVLRTDDSTGKNDVPLITRTNAANKFGADLLVSIHHNASLGTWGDWTGTETYVYTPISANPKSERLAKLVHPRIVKVMGLKDRGIKGADFHMVRETDMPSILLEIGYMDSRVDIVKMRNKELLRKVGIEIGKGILEYLGASSGTKRDTHDESIKSGNKKPVTKKPTVKKDTYKVKKGDKLYGIAKKFDISLDQLKLVNDLKSDEINAGDVLCVKRDVPVTRHIKVKKGDTLWDLAVKYDVSVADLKKWNKLKGDLINPGDDLRVK